MTDRARRVVPRTRPAAEHQVIPGTQTHPLQPLQGFRGPLRWSGHLLAAKRAGWVYPGITLPGTHPVYPPRYTHPGTPPFCASCTPVLGTTGTCTYDRFREVVGEPRGSRTHVLYGSLEQYGTHITVYTAV